MQVETSISTIQTSQELAQRNLADEQGPCQKIYDTVSVGNLIFASGSARA
jgi:hypothetical protein